MVLPKDITGVYGHSKQGWANWLVFKLYHYCFWKACNYEDKQTDKQNIIFYLVIVTSLKIYNNNIIVFSVVTKFPKERGINWTKAHSIILLRVVWEKSWKKESCVHIERMSNVA